MNGRLDVEAFVFDDGAATFQLGDGAIDVGRVIGQGLQTVFHVG